jgi:hypothetical protein
VAMSGRAGDQDWHGIRVVVINFTLYNSNTGRMRATEASRNTPVLPTADHLLYVLIFQIAGNAKR